MDGVETLHSKPNGKGIGSIPIPKPDGTLSQAERRMSKTSTNMPVTEKETKSLVEQNTKIIGLIIALATLVGVVYTISSKFAAYEFKIEQLEKRVEKLVIQHEADAERKLQKAIEDAKIAGYQIGKTENKK